VRMSFFMICEFLSVEVENGIFIDSDEGISARKMTTDTRLFREAQNALTQEKSFSIHPSYPSYLSSPCCKLSHIFKLLFNKSDVYP